MFDKMMVYANSFYDDEIYKENMYKGRIHHKNV